MRKTASIRTSVKESEKREAVDSVIAFLLILSMAFITYLCLLLRLHYSVDSYAIIRNQNIPWYLMIGRYTLWAITAIIDALGINLVVTQRAFLLLAIVSISISLLTIYRLIYPESPKSAVDIIFKAAPLCLIWINVSVLDLLLFPEAAVQIAVGSLLVTEAARITIKPISSSGAINNTVSTLLLLLALGCYQSYVGVYISLVLVIGIQQQPSSTTYIRYVFRCLLIALVSSIICVASMKLLVIFGLVADSGRGAISEISELLSNIKNVLDYQVSFWKDADGLLAFPIMPLTILTLLISLIRTRRVTRVWKSNALFFAFIISYCSSYAPHFVETICWLSPRSNLAVWASIGCTVAVANSMATHDIETDSTGCAIYASDFKRLSSQINTKCISFLALPIVLMFIPIAYDISYDAYVSNSFDKYYASQIASKITEYEEKSGKTITSIAITNDASPSTRNPGVRYRSYELNQRIMLTKYSRVGLINYIGGLSLREVPFNDAELSEIATSNNWDQVDLGQQLFFRDETVYLIVY